MSTKTNTPPKGTSPPTEEHSFFDKIGQPLIDWIGKDGSYFSSNILAILFISLFIFFEHFISGITSFSVFENMFRSFLPLGWAFAIGLVFLIAFEGVKFLLYISVWLPAFRNKGAFSWPKFFFCCLLTGASFWLTQQGAKPLVINHSKEAILLDASDLTKFYGERIASLNKTVAHLQANDDKSITLVTGKKVDKYLTQIKEYEGKITQAENSRANDNEIIKEETSQTQRFTAKELVGYAWVLNLLSFFGFSLIIARFIGKSERDYLKRKAEAEAQAKAQAKAEAEEVERIAKQAEAEAEAETLRRNAKGNGKGILNLDSVSKVETETVKEAVLPIKGKVFETLSKGAKRLIGDLHAKESNAKPRQLFCIHCEKVLASNRRSTAKYCNDICRNAYNNLKRKK